MKQTRSRLKAFIIYFVTVMQLATVAAPLPAAIYAQEAPAEAVPCVAPANMRQPTGSSAHMFSWNCDTNLWENSFYTWDTTTGVISPKFAPEHRFDEASNLWQIWQWQYVPPANAYQLQLVSTYAPAPAAAADPPTSSQAATIDNTGPGSDNSITNSDGTIQNTGPDSTNVISDVDGSILNTGPQSNNSISLDPNGNQTNIGINVSVGVTNDVNSTAVSGDASVLQNTTAGNALSGDASAIANILNMLQSTWGLNGYKPDIYTANIQGDYVGDILIDPALLGVSSDGGCACGDLTVRSDVDSSITNNVDLLARSGDATVSENTKAGDATSGDATALANIVNMINSSITSGQSFLGILNINGNFTGNVLVAQDVIDQLLAANVPTAQISMCGCGDVTADFNTTQKIDNNINTTATSGSADVTNNTTAGNATSGSADTSVTVFNLTGRNIVGQNALLVFVNVLGEWVGFITDAPGATAAAFGGGITQNSSGGDTEYSVDNDMSITNNVNVTAETGDAEVSYNTSAGNATSGNAKAAANVSNIMSSNFSLTGWFGLLFINVTGNWFGNFGIKTPTGTTTFPTEAAVSGGFQSVPNNAAGTGHGAPKVRIFSANFENNNKGAVVLADVTETTPPTSTAAQSFGATNSSLQNAVIGWVMLAVGTGVIIYFFRRRSI